MNIKIDEKTMNICIYKGNIDFNMYIHVCTLYVQCSYMSVHCTDMFILF